MPRLPQPGKDAGEWGTILNDFLSSSLAADGSLKSNTVGSSQLQAGSVTAAKVAADVATQVELDALAATTIPRPTTPAIIGKVPIVSTTTPLAFDWTAVGENTPLSRWKRKLALSPSTAKVVFLGDSTSEGASAAGYMYHRLRTFHTRPGESLAGLFNEAFTDISTTAGSPIITSATANFSSSDIGKSIFPTNTTHIVAPTWIQSVQSSTQATLSSNALSTQATTGITIGRQIVDQGYSGLYLGPIGQGWLADSAKQAALWNENPDLIVASWLLNDVRLGQCTLESAIDRLKAMIELIQLNLPNCDILLRIPNPMITTNVSSQNYVQNPVGTINPTGAAQLFTDLIRSAYYGVMGTYSHVDLFDSQTEIFGKICRATHPLIADQLHPSPGYTGGGYWAIANGIASKIGIGDREGGWTSHDRDAAWTTSVQLQANGGGVGFLDISSTKTKGIPAAQYPIDSTWSLHIEGVNSPISLSGTTIFRPFGGTNIRITGLGSTNFVPHTGKRILATTDSAGRIPTTQDRQVIAVDLASIAANSTTTATVTVTGARAGNVHDANSITVTPPSGFSSSGLLLLNAYPTANDTVTLVINNPTGSPIDRASETWTFWVVR